MEMTSHTVALAILATPTKEIHQCILDGSPAGLSAVLFDVFDDHLAGNLFNSGIPQVPTELANLLPPCAKSGISNFSPLGVFNKLLKSQFKPYCPLLPR